MGELKKDEIIMLPEFYSKMYNSTLVTISDEYIIWNNKRIKEDVDSIVKIIMSDYSSTIDKAEKIIDDYLKLDSNEIQDIDVANIIKTFLDTLCNLHPFFSIRRSKFLLINQIFCTLVLKLKDFEVEDGEVCKLINLYIKPIIEIIFSNDEAEELKSKLTNLENELNKRISESTLYTSAYYKDTPLDSIRESLDNLKTFAYILVSPGFNINKLGDSYIMEEFAANQSYKLQEKYKEIKMDIYLKSQSSDRFIFDELGSFRITIYSLSHKISKNEIDENYHGMDIIENLMKGDIIISYRIFCFEQLVYLYLKFLLNKKMNLKICKNCKRLFIPKHFNQKYCLNFIENKNGKTCRDIGPSKAYEHDKINHAIRKNTKYIITNIKRAKDSEEQKRYKAKLDNWTEESKKIKNKYTESKEDNKNTKKF